MYPRLGTSVLDPSKTKIYFTPNFHDRRWGYYPRFMTVGEDRNKDRFTNWKFTVFESSLFVNTSVKGHAEWASFTGNEAKYLVLHCCNLSVSVALNTAFTRLLAAFDCKSHLNISYLSLWDTSVSYRKFRVYL